MPMLEEFDLTGNEFTDLESLGKRVTRFGLLNMFVILDF